MRTKAPKTTNTKRPHTHMSIDRCTLVYFASIEARSDQGSEHYKHAGESLQARIITDFSDFLARIESCQLISVVGRVG